MWRVRGVAALLAVCVICPAGAGRLGLNAQSAEPTAGSDRRAEAFARRLVQALARRDRTAVAAMVRYPAMVLAGGFNIPVLDRATALHLYDLVFTAELRCLLEQSGLRRAGQPAPKYPIRVDAAGAAFGDGRIRAEQTEGGLKITRIVVPPASGLAPPPASKPQRVAFRWGQTEAQYAGRLYGDGVDSYLVSAGPGTLLEARIERFPGRRAAIRVTHQASGRVLERPGAP